MINSESSGDLVLELFYKVLRIVMDRFLELMIPDLTPQSPSRCPPNENEIRSPSWYLNRPNSRRFYQRKSLQFDTIMEMSENQIDLDMSSTDSSQRGNKLNSTSNTDLEEFKIYNIHPRTVHFSPKLLTSHFEDSGFLNCSIEMTPRLETTSEKHSLQGVDAPGHEISFDSYLQGEDHSHSWLKIDSNSSVNCSLITESCDENFNEYSKKNFKVASKLSEAKLTTEIKNACDGPEICV